MGFDMTATFDEFYKIYPLKKSKLDAMKAWNQVTKDHSPDDIVAGLKRNLPAILRRAPYIKFPATWLRAGGWMDEDGPPPPGNGRTGHGLIDAMLSQERH